MSPAKRAAIFANNDDAHRTAKDLAAAGVEVAAVIDSRPDATAARPGLVDDDREQLVGVRPVAASRQLIEDAHLFNEGDPHDRELDQGYLTSVGWSLTYGN